MAVEGAWRTVSSPSGVSHTGLGDGDLVEVDGRLIDVLAESSDLADLLEDQSVLFGFAVDSNTGTVVASVFETGKTVDEIVNDLLTVLLHQVVDISENAALQDSNRIASSSCVYL